jgi:hypothetical protein
MVSSSGRSHPLWMMMASSCDVMSKFGSCFVPLKSEWEDYICICTSWRASTADSFFKCPMIVAAGGHLPSVRSPNSSSMAHSLVAAAAATAAASLSQDDDANDDGDDDDESVEWVPLHRHHQHDQVRSP